MAGDEDKPYIVTVQYRCHNKWHAEVVAQLETMPLIISGYDVPATVVSIKPEGDSNVADG